MWMRSLTEFIENSLDLREVKRAMPSVRLLYERLRQRQRSQDVTLRVQA